MLRRLLPLLFSCLLTLLPYAHMQAAPIHQTAAITYQGIVNNTANIRRGPGLQYEVVDQAQLGQNITVVACNEDCTWFQLDTGNWIAAFLVDLRTPTNSSSSNSSNEDNNTNENNSRTGSSVFDADDLTLNPPSPAALEIVAQILSYTGLPQSFEVYSSNIYNAAALIANGKRVILYDPQLIADIENITKHDWPAVSILAHEIGHHLAGHTLAEKYNRVFELEADYFSGFILYKMGATLDESQAVMNLLRDHPNMTDYPPQADRLIAIENGWQEAARQEGLAAWEPPFSNFEEEAAQNSEASYIPSNTTAIFVVLQKAHAQALLAKNKDIVYPLREWELGLAALKTQ